MAEKLLPCPFCGASASIERLGDRSRSTVYQCDNCSCSLETGEEWGHGAGWNKRAVSLHWFRPRETHETVTLEKAATRLGTFEAWGGGGCYLDGERLDREGDERSLAGAKVVAERHYASIVTSGAHPGGNHDT